MLDAGDMTTQLKTGCL